MAPGFLRYLLAYYPELRPAVLTAGAVEAAKISDETLAAMVQGQPYTTPGVKPLRHTQKTLRLEAMVKWLSVFF